MKCNILLEEDEELRGYIKELIKSQVVSISREEVAQLVIEHLKTKLSKLDSRADLAGYVENVIQKTISKMVKVHIDRAMDLEFMQLKQRMERIVSENVDHIASERYIKEKTDAAIEKLVKKRFSYLVGEE